ncbi:MULTISPECIES: GntR family transcriptional regulator [Streptomyces]|uniref:GntR family transcriptional regulator n=1 Tax=Streptomyces lycopersici TaxID=2974589 RepID=UPI0021D2F627|nr:GntR family transcriptional regulator [Streptomyces sp. NEAU-383]
MKKASPTAESIAELIRGSIVSGELPSGAPVTEKWTAEKYAISRLTVREVLQSLIAEGYLVRRPYHSAHVRTFTDKEMQDILDARELLEGYAGSRSINAAEADRARLRSALDDYLAAMDGDDLAEGSRRHRALHVALVGMTGNERLMRQEEQLMVDSSMMVAVIDARRDDVEKMKRMHVQLVDAFLDGNQQLALQLVREHLHMVGKAATEELGREPVAAANPPRRYN